MKLSMFFLASLLLSLSTFSSPLTISPCSSLFKFEDQLKGMDPQAALTHMVGTPAFLGLEDFISVAKPDEVFNLINKDDDSESKTRRSKVTLNRIKYINSLVDDGQHEVLAFQTELRLNDAALMEPIQLRTLRFPLAANIQALAMTGLGTIFLTQENTRALGAIILGATIVPAALGLGYLKLAARDERAFTNIEVEKELRFLGKYLRSKEWFYLGLNNSDGYNDKTLKKREPSDSYVFLNDYFKWHTGFFVEETRLINVLRAYVLEPFEKIYGKNQVTLDLLVEKNRINRVKLTVVMTRPKTLQTEELRPITED